MRRKLSKLSEFNRSDWAIVIRAAFWLLITDLGLRILGYARVRQLLARTGRKNTSVAAVTEPPVIQRICYLTDLVARYHLHRITCLPRSLALQRILTQHGVHTDLRIGVRKEDGKLIGHAWLEYEGQAIGETGDVETRFAPLLSRELSG